MALTTSILTGGSNSHQETSETANGVATDLGLSGVTGPITNTAGVAPATGSFAVNAQGSPDTTVAVSTGIAYVTATPTSQNSQALRVRNSASANVTIAANSSGSTKFDWLYVSISATNSANPNSAADNVATLVTSRSSNANTDDGTPPTYGTLLAVVSVANGFSSISNSNITDRRTVISPRTSSDGWIGVTDTWAFASSTTITVPTDATLTYQAGDKLRLTQTTVKYFIVTKVTATVLTIYGGTDYTLANAAISNIGFSRQKSPFGFPIDPAKWTVTTTSTSDRTTTGTTFTTFTDAITVPTGVWELSWSGEVYVSTVSDPASARIAYVTLSDVALSSTSVTYQDLTAVARLKIGATTTSPLTGVSAFCKTWVNISASTTYTMYGRTSAGSPTTTAALAGSDRTTTIKAVCALL